MNDADAVREFLTVFDRDREQGAARSSPVNRGRAWNHDEKMARLGSRGFVSSDSSTDDGASPAAGLRLVARPKAP